MDEWMEGVEFVLEVGIINRKKEGNKQKKIKQLRQGHMNATLPFTVRLFKSALAVSVENASACAHVKANSEGL